MYDINSVNLIQSMLAPGLMISACGLLLLGIHNKYGLVVNRIRTLEEEKRRIIAIHRKDGLDPDQKVRFNSIVMQVEKFEFRIKLVRNAVFFYTLAVAFFVLSSLAIGFNIMTGLSGFQTLSLILFLTGMTSVLVAIIFAAREVWKGYAIVRIEVKESEIAL